MTNNTYVVMDMIEKLAAYFARRWPTTHSLILIEPWISSFVLDNDAIIIGVQIVLHGDYFISLPIYHDFAHNALDFWQYCLDNFERYIHQAYYNRPVSYLPGNIPSYFSYIAQWFVLRWDAPYVTLIGDSKVIGRIRRTATGLCRMLDEWLRKYEAQRLAVVAAGLRTLPLPISQAILEYS